MITKQEIEKQIDFTVDHEVVLYGSLSSQRKVINMEVHSGMVSSKIQFNSDSFKSMNKMTLLYVLAKRNIIDAVLWSLDNLSELPPTIEDLLFQVMSKTIKPTASGAIGDEDESALSIICEIVCEELARELNPEYKELVEMARKGESLC
jgi:hypothetical protein